MEEVLENHRSVWDRVHSRGYQGYTKDPVGRTKIIKSMAPDKFNGKTSVLEIGCGSGEIMKVLADDVFQIWGVDISEEAINIAWDNIKQRPNAFAAVNDGFTLKEFDDGFFDLVYSFWTFQHIPKEVSLNYVRESRRVLRDDGKMVFQVVSYDDQARNGGDIGVLSGETRQIGYTWKMVQQLIRGGGMRLSFMRTERWLPDRIFFWVTCEK